MKSNSPASSSTNLFLVAVVAVLASIMAFQWWANHSAANSPVTYQSRNPEARGDFSTDEKSTISIFRQSSPSVVSIRVKISEAYSGREQEVSSGSGVVWDDQGHILTNFHVVERAVIDTQFVLEVQFADQTVLDAIVVGGVREDDLAVLRVSKDSTKLVPIRLGTSNDLEVGQTVLAIGSPFGFDQTLSTGVIGGLNRSVSSEQGTPLTGLIQTDAAINPGNSGGPLLDSDGRLIGVNTAIISPTGAYSGLGFAVPASKVMESVDLVFSHASGTPRPIIGVSVMSPEGALRYQVPKETVARGLLIQFVDPRGPAAQLGLQPTRILYLGNGIFKSIIGDQIAGIDGQPVVTLRELHAAIRKHQPGDQVTLDVYRGDRLLQMDVVLQAATIIL
ncbi:MAG: trypsin-like peptidase domain-containing protein [Fuerstiella sp.]